MQELPHEFVEHRLQVPTELQHAGGLYMLRSGLNRAKPNYRVGPRLLDCYSFHFIVSGSVSMSDEAGRRFRFNAGTMFCMFPGFRYTYWREENGEVLQMRWIAFAGSQAPLAVAALGLAPESPAIPYDGGERWQSLMKDLHAGVSKHRKFQQTRLLYELFELLLSSSGRKEEEDADGGDLRRRSDMNWLLRSEAYLRLHYAEPIRIEDLAEQAGVHRSHFSSAFRRMYGMSPKQFVTQLRLQTAAALLTTRDIPVQDAALSVGYPDLFSFTRAFTKYYGMAPTKYRQSHLGK